MAVLPEFAFRRCHDVVNKIHSAFYFSPEFGTELAELGLEDRAAAYFVGRAAPFGRVRAGIITSAFFVFDHALVARHIPAVWDVVSPEAALAARLRAVDKMLRRRLGEVLIASQEMIEAADLALLATQACTRQARPLYAANADLPVPEPPHLALWYAATLLREHRGDSHVITLVNSGLDPVEALVSHTATGQGRPVEWVLETRGLSTHDWQAAERRLRDRGLLTSDNVLTAAGAQLREKIEADTDRLDAAPYEYLGGRGVARLTELATAFSASIAEDGSTSADSRAGASGGG
ncbi:hypothetical protein [Streptomyces sp. Z26]|uniref:SCO6745 family protein n=1 Tax=Streptomyces sp. Z26 TaxID=2500177 RepID=UPI000EF16782|nr:hypothetical protein [Streptomyces sp. Z26]RLL67628.1 hypothetical protein D7M15_13095 [Streptomyces sp. Z26]